MKVFLFGIAVFALAVVFGRFEPAASAAPVTADDVVVVSENVIQETGQPGARTKNGNKTGKSTLHRRD